MGDISISIEDRFISPYSFEQVDFDSLHTIRVIKGHKSRKGFLEKEVNEECILLNFSGNELSFVYANNLNDNKYDQYKRMLFVLSKKSVDYLNAILSLLSLHSLPNLTQLILLSNDWICM